MNVSLNANLLYADSDYKFYLEPLNDLREQTFIIMYKDNIIYSQNILIMFGFKPIQKVYKGKSGTYSYFKVTLKCDNNISKLCKELIFVELAKGILRLEYFDTDYADINTSRLVIKTKKGGLSIKRIYKNF